MECSTTKDGTENCLADISTIMDAKEFALLLFFMLHRELLVCRAEHMTCQLKSGRGNWAVRPRSWREV